MSRGPPTPEFIEEKTVAPQVEGRRDYVVFRDSFTEREFYTPSFFVDPVVHAQLRKQSRDRVRGVYALDSAPQSSRPSNLTFAAEDVLDVFPSSTEVYSLQREIEYYAEYFNISYKAAVHRLYVAELAALRAHNEALVEITAIKDEINTIIESELCAPIRMIDAGVPAALNPIPGEVLELKANEGKAMDFDLCVANGP